MTNPLIGLTSYHRNEEDRFTLPANYLAEIERAGAISVVVTPQTQNLSELLQKLDGLILTGGADVDPANYAGEHKQEVYGVNPERDRFELELATLALKVDIPTMAICRGIQVVNVALGGTLVEHIPDEYGETVAHRGENFNKVMHPVAIEPDSKLAQILGLTQFNCPSFHHQSVRKPAEGFRVVAQSADGVIEAIESEQHPKLIAVQWHPEYTAQTDRSQHRLFAALVAWASGKDIDELSEDKQVT